MCVCVVDLAAIPVTLVILDAATRRDRRCAGRRSTSSRSTPARIELRIGATGKPAGARLVGHRHRRHAAAPAACCRRSRHHAARERGRRCRVLASWRPSALASVIFAYVYGVPLLAERLVGARAARLGEAARRHGGRPDRDRARPTARASRSAIPTPTASPTAPSPASPTDAFDGTRIAVHPRRHGRPLRQSPTPSRCPAGRPTISRRCSMRAETPDEFAGVLAHELGHVYYRHGMETLISTLGDRPARRLRPRRHDRPLGRRRPRRGADRQPLLARCRTRRPTLRRRDRAAPRLPARRASSTCSIASPSDDAFSRALALFSNHPLTDERRAALEALRHARRNAAAVQRSEWAAIKAMCRSGPAIRATSVARPPVAPPPPRLPANRTCARLPCQTRPMRILVRTSKWAIWARRFGALALPLAAIPVLLHREQRDHQRQFPRHRNHCARRWRRLRCCCALVAFARLWVTGDQGWGTASWRSSSALSASRRPAISPSRRRSYPPRPTSPPISPTRRRL